MKDFFKPEDFELTEWVTPWVLDRMVTKANAKLGAEIEKWPKLYKYPHMFGWSEVSESIHTPIHTARLAFIEEIRPKECEHEPRFFPDVPNILFEDAPHCKHCGIKLRAKWEPAE